MITSEEDFENLTPRQQNPDVAIDNKHAYKKVVNPPLISTDNKKNKEASPSKVISSIPVGISNIPVTSEKVMPDNREISSVVTTPKHRREKINNLEQKEENLAKAGVTRLKYMQRIAEALDAVKTVQTNDEQGNVKYITVPDTARNQWGVEMAAKLYGDMIERKEIEHDIGETTLSRMRALTVVELKAKAADILLGKNRMGVSVEDAETRASA